MLTRGAAARRILSGMRSPAFPARRAWLPAVTGGLLATLAVAGCGPQQAASQQTAATAPPTHAAPAATLAAPSPTPSPTPTCDTTVASGFPCAMRDRIVDVKHYLRRLPGTIGIVLHDRTTGATWHNAHAGTLIPAASTIKLAMMTDLLLRNRAGQIHLTPADRAAMFQALYTSNDDDATYLWNRYEDASFMDRARAFGMHSTQFTNSAFWGNVDTTARDLDNLINYVLTKTPPHIRGYLVHRLQHVSALDQQWGVWGAGPANHPGNKDGWEQDPDGFGVWITNTVGFAGPNQQYTLAITYNMGSFGENGNTGFKFGTNKLTQIAAMLFQGQHTGTPHPQASAVP
jgi:hypothetical protein